MSFYDEPRVCHLADGISVVIPTDARASRRLLFPVLMEALGRQCFPKLQVVVVGPAEAREFYRGFGVDYVSADLETATGLLGAKMLRGVQETRHSLVLMAHDDVVLADDFWECLAGSAADWHFAAPGYLYAEGEFRGVPLSHRSVQYPVWTLGGPKGHRWLAEGEEWDPWSYVSGESLLGWRGPMLAVGWDALNDHRISRGTSGAFDVQFGHRANALGFRTRFLPSTREWCLEL